MNPMDTATPPALGPPSGEQRHQCDACAGRTAAAADRYVYAIGKLDVRFPSLGIEREFQQRERQLFAEKTAPKGRGELLHAVLEANVHLAQRVCYVLQVGGVPAYILAPSGASLRAELLQAVRHLSRQDHWVVAIGRAGGLGAPASCGGIVAPLVSTDQIYAFRESEWFESLKARLEPILEERNVQPGDMRDPVLELFARVLNSGENVGGTDAHRALNFAIVQHPGVFLAYLERADRFVLDRIETRLLPGIGTRRTVAVVLTFIERSTGVPERLFCRVDVTEEWPFLAGAMEGYPASLGLERFVDTESLTAPM